MLVKILQPSSVTEALKIGGENMPEGKEEIAVFEIGEKNVNIISMEAIYGEKDKKEHNRCYATIGFGYFFIMDIGISKVGDEEITWSHDFSWSKFKFNWTIPDNPYYPEVEKVLKLIANEIEKKKDKIVGFLDSNKGWLNFRE